MPDCALAPRFEPEATLLALIADSGYMVERGPMNRLAQHLSNLDGRVVPWTAGYLVALARGRLKASARMLDAIDRARRYPPPALESIDPGRAIIIECPSCGHGFIPNVPWRKRCELCSPRPRR